MCTHKSISDCALYFKVKPGESEDWRLPKLATNPLDTEAVIRSCHQKLDGGFRGGRLSLSLSPS